jgi:DNA-binding beta-propeller fold protein YncE
VVDAASGAVTATIKVADETGNVTFDDTSDTGYVAARSPDALVAFDPTTHRITRRQLLPGCDGAHGVYLDPGTRRAFVACENNARMVTVDLGDGGTISTDTLGDGPDVLAYDIVLRRLYVASESGTVTVFDTTRPAPCKIGEAHLADGAHSVAVDQSTHHVFFPLPSVRGRPVLRVMAPSTSGEPSGIR